MSLRARSNPEPGASVSELLRDGVGGLLDRDAALERWFSDEVIAGREEYLAGHSKEFRRMRFWHASRRGRGMLRSDLDLAVQSVS